jgi:putative ABC transport system permease protein
MIISPRWRKVVRDVLANKGRTFLVVMAISVGVVAFGSVFTTQEILLRDMNEQYAAINPTPISISVSSFDEQLVRSVRGIRSVAYAEGRTSALVRFKARDEWTLLSLYAIPSYEDQVINLIIPEEGTWPPNRREILFERASAEMTDAQIGDTVTIELFNNQQRELVFAGTVHDLNAVPPALYPQLIGYVTLETLRWLGYSGEFRTLSIMPAGELTELAQIEKVAAEVKERLERDGYEVSSVDTEKPGEHWAADTTQAFIRILLGIGFFALFLSGFLIINTTSAVLAQQKRQIGMMKAIGATGMHVIGIYLTMIVLYGLMALVIAIPLSAALASVAIGRVADFLNIDIADLHLPPYIFVLQILLALIVPMLAAMVPILSGTRVTVRQAVSDYGISETATSGLIDRVLAKVRALPRPTLLSLRNTFRRRARLLLTLATLTLAGMTFIAVVNVRDSMIAELGKITRLFNYDVQLALDGPYRMQQLEREAYRVPGVVDVEGWAFAQMQRIRPDGSEGSTFTVFGPPADTPFIEPTLLEGRWLRPGDENDIVLSSELLRDEPDIRVGDEIMLLMGDTRRKWQVVGILNLVGQKFAYTNFDYLSRVQGAPGQSFVLIVGTEQSSESYQKEVAEALEDHFEQVGIGVTQSMTLGSIIGASIEQFNFLVSFLLAMTVMLGAVGGLGLAGTMSLNVLERTREIGVMRAIGASDGAVRSVIIIEGLVIGFLSWIAGTVFSIPASRAFIKLVGEALFERPLDFTFSTIGIAAWLGIVLVIATLASLIPAQRASRISVRESLAYE